MDTQRSTAKKYHDYGKDAFCIASYSNKDRPHLKYTVRCKVAGKWVQRFFKNEKEAKTYVQLRRIEMHNHGVEGMMSAGGRAMAQWAIADLRMGRGLGRMWN